MTLTEARTILVPPLLFGEPKRRRDAEGRKSYGTSLQAHNGRDPMTDAYQEVLDLALYLRQAIEEIADLRAALTAITRLPDETPFPIECASKAVEIAKRALAGGGA